MYVQHEDIQFLLMITPEIDIKHDISDQDPGS